MTMKTSTMRITVLAGAAVVTAGLLAAATTLIVVPQPAQAHPAYAQKTGYHCSQCHVNTKGGGKLNDFGIKWVSSGMKMKAPVYCNSKYGAPCEYHGVSKITK